MSAATAGFSVTILLMLIFLPSYRTQGQSVVDYSVERSLDINEGDVIAQMCATITTLSGNIATATVTTRDSTAEAAGDDYTALQSRPLGFTSASVEGEMRCVNISITDDTELEKTETFEAEVSMTTEQDNRPVTKSTLFSITDNDVNITVPESVSGPEAMELGGMVTAGTGRVCASLRGNSTATTISSPINATITASESSPVSATAGTDFSALSLNISFAAQSKDGDRECVEFPYIDDSDLEPFETFTTTLAVTDDTVTVVNSRTMVTIEDDDVIVSVPLDASFVESEVGEVCVLLTTGPDATASTFLETFTFEVVTNESSPVSAMSGTDFTMLPEPNSAVKIFPADAIDGTTACFSIPIINDNALEGDETLTVSLMIVDGDPNLGNTDTRVTIIDDDSVTVIVPAMSVGEGNERVQVCATLSDVTVATEREFMVTLVTHNGTAMPGSDYMSISSDQFFPSGSTESANGCVNITIFDDDALEGDHTFIVMPTTSDDGVKGVLGIITIIDDDSVMVSVPAMVTVGRGDRTVQVCATLSTMVDIQRDFTIMLDTSNETAMADSDYTSVSSDEVFTSGSANGATRCVNVPILNDNPFEEDLNFTVALTTFDPDVMLGNDVTVVTITDSGGRLSPGVIAAIVICGLLLLILLCLLCFLILLCLCCFCVKRRRKVISHSSDEKAGAIHLTTMEKHDHLTTTGAGGTAGTGIVYHEKTVYQEKVATVVGYEQKSDDIFELLEARNRTSVTIDFNESDDHSPEGFFM